MKFTIHKWVLNAMTGPNATQYTKFDKYVVKNEIGPNLVRDRISHMVSAILLLLLSGKHLHLVGRFSNTHLGMSLVQEIPWPQSKT